MERCGYGKALEERARDVLVVDSIYRWLVSATPEMAKSKLTSHERYCLICAAAKQETQS